MQTIDLGLGNTELYDGCEIEEVAGRLNLVTPIKEAVQIVGRNTAEIAKTVEPGGVVLTGPMAVWAYMIVFHAVVHKTATVWYDDGRNSPVLLAAHGSRVEHEASIPRP